MGNYEIKETIGNGSFGTIFKAETQSSVCYPKTVAIKQVMDKKIGETEIKAMKELGNKCPYIIQFLGVCQPASHNLLKNGTSFALPMFDQDLKQFRDEVRHISELNSFIISKSLGFAIGFLQKMKIIHR